MMEVADTDNLEFDGKKVRDAERQRSFISDIATASMCNNNETSSMTETNSSSSIPTIYVE